METTVFADTARHLGERLREAAVDHDAFERPMQVCELSACRATCCYDGVILSAEEAGILEDLSDEEDSGIESWSDGRFKTATRSTEGSRLACDFPDHFARTRCHFLDERHRCRWQTRSVAEQRAPWYYKPISCWMHPLVLRERDGRPFLTILSRSEDEKQFASFTPCGREVDGGSAARLVLRQELEMLAAISGRDFYDELNAPPGFSS